MLYEYSYCTMNHCTELTCARLWPDKRPTPARSKRWDIDLPSVWWAQDTSNALRVRNDSSRPEYHSQSKSYRTDESYLDARQGFDNFERCLNVLKIPNADECHFESFECFRMFTRSLAQERAIEFIAKSPCYILFNIIDIIKREYYMYVVTYLKVRFVNIES